MSSKAECSKDVEIMHPDTDEEEWDESIMCPDPDEEEMGERITSSSRTDFPGVSSKDLSDSQMDYDRHERGNLILEGHELWILEERKKFQFQESEKRVSPKKKTEEPKGIRGTFENITRLQQGEPITSSSPSLPPGVSSKDLSNSHTDDHHERVNSILEDYELRVLEERNKHLQFQKSEIR